MQAMLSPQGRRNVLVCSHDRRILTEDLRSEAVLQQDSRESGRALAKTMTTELEVSETCRGFDDDECQLYGLAGSNQGVDKKQGAGASNGTLEAIDGSAGYQLTRPQEQKLVSVRSSSFGIGLVMSGAGVIDNGFSNVT